jgi:hypothetical protein
VEVSSLHDDGPGVFTNPGSVTDSSRLLTFYDALKDANQRASSADSTPQF